MKKKIIYLVFILVMVFIASACGGTNTDKAGANGREQNQEVKENEKGQQEEIETSSKEEKEKEDNKPADNKETEATESEKGEEISAVDIEDPKENSAEGEVKDGTTPITDAQIDELKSYIKDAVVSEYLEPNGLTPADLEWPEDWSEFIAAEESIGLNLSIGMPDEIVVNSSIDAVLKGVQNWFLKQGSFDYSYSQNVMHLLEPFYEVIPAIDYSAE